MRPKLAAMRRDRSVLWVEPMTDGRRAAAQRAAGAPAGHGAGAYVDVGQKLLVRLVGDPAPDWSTLMPRLVERMGAAAIAERQVGNVWALRLMSPVRSDRLAQIAASIAEDPAVQYADPVRRRFAKLLVPERSVICPAVVAPRSGGRHQHEAAWLKPRRRRGEHDGRRRRHGNPPASRPRRPRAAGLRLHLRAGARATATPATRTRATKATGATANAAQVPRASSTGSSSPA